MFLRNRPNQPRSAWWLVAIGVAVLIGGVLWIWAAEGDVPGRVGMLPIVGLVLIVLGIVFGIRGKKLE